MGVWLFFHFLISMLLVIFSPKRLSKKQYFLIAIAPILSMAISLFYWIGDSFTGRGIDESVFFHLRVGFEGIDLGNYKKLIWIVLTGLFLSITFTFFLYKRILSDSRFSFIGKRSYVLLILLFIMHPLSLDIVKIYGVKYLDRYNFPNFSDYYHSVRADKSAFKVDNDKRTIILLYLESLEQAYYENNELFNDVMPSLNKITQDYLTFSNIDQVAGTTFTMAGMVSSQCGVPLLDANNPDSYTENYQGVWSGFLSGATCLGDLFNSMGYTNYYVGGASLAFAGKGDFYTSHGFNKRNIFGRDEFDQEALHEGKGRLEQSVWGQYDEVIFEKILEIYHDGSNQQKYIVGLNIGIHDPGNLISPHCKAHHQKYDEDFLNILDCTDTHLDRFVENIRQSPNAKNTVIVLASDHLSMRNAYTDQLNKLPKRRNLFTIIDFNKPIKKQIDKAGSTLDIGATLIDYLDINDDEKLGLGRSLLREMPTLVEEFTSKTDRALRVWREDMLALWEFPKLNDSLWIIKEDNFQIGKNTARLPLIIGYDSSYNIRNAQGRYNDHPYRADLFNQYRYLNSINKELYSKNNVLMAINCKDFYRVLPKLTKHSHDSMTCLINIKLELNDVIFDVIELNESYQGGFQELLNKSSVSYTENYISFLAKLKAIQDNFYE